MVLRLQRLNFRRNDEQRGEKILQVRRKVQQQRRLLLQRQGRRVSARGDGLRGQRGICGPQMVSEQIVDAAIAFDRIKVGKREAVG